MRKSESKGSKLGGILFLGFFFIICVGVGILGIYSGINDIINTKDSLDWPQTNGKVIKSSFEASKGSGSKESTSKRTTGSSVVWHADIEYEYTVGGQSYKNYRVSYGDYGSSEKSNAQATLNRYPVGKTIPVYYKPDDPSESVLEPEGTKQGIMIKFIVGSVFMFLGAIIALAPYLASKIKNRLDQKS